MFPQNSERVSAKESTAAGHHRQSAVFRRAEISANDNDQNQSYPNLDGRIAPPTPPSTDALTKTPLRFLHQAIPLGQRPDRQTMASSPLFQMAAWLDGNSMDGLRACLQKEFSSIWVFNLRGNQRTIWRTIAEKKAARFLARAPAHPLPSPCSSEIPARKAPMRHPLSRHRRLPQPRRKARHHQQVPAQWAHPENALATTQPNEHQRLDEPTG